MRIVQHQAVREQIQGIYLISLRIEPMTLLFIVVFEGNGFDSQGMPELIKHTP